jgi:hypothetical protein
MDIEHIGNLVISTPICSLHLNNILHVPRIHKQLISIHRFTLDNNTFVELHPFFFWLRIRSRRGCCSTAHVREVFTLSTSSRLHIRSFFLLPSSLHLNVGTVILDTRLRILFVVFFSPIIFRTLVLSRPSQCVMLAFTQKLTNYLLLCLAANLLLL